MKLLKQGTLLLIAATLATGCARTPIKSDPAYAPVVPPVPVSTEENQGAIYQAGFGMMLYEDNKAYRVGDIMTVLLEEETDASKSQSTSTSRSQNIDHPGPNVFGNPITYRGKPLFGVSVANDSEFDGEGEANQRNSLSGSITVTVASVLTNGNMVVRGEKIISLNQGDEFIRFSGIVRPRDVSPDNTVSSRLVANARISYGGNGDLEDANRQGWLARFFNKVWPF